MTTANTTQTTQTGLTKQVRIGLASALIAGAAFTMFGQASTASAAQVSHGSSVYGKLNQRYTEEKLTDDEIYKRSQEEDLSYGDFEEINKRILNGEASDDSVDDAEYVNYSDSYQQSTYPEIGQDSTFHGSSIYGKLRLRYTDEKLTDDEIYKRSQEEDLSYGDFEEINKRILNENTEID